MDEMNTVVNTMPDDAADDTVNLSDILAETVETPAQEDAPAQTEEAADDAQEQSEQTTLEAERERWKAGKEAALRAQSRKYQPDVRLAQTARDAFAGMTDEQIAQAMLDYRAAKMAEEDPEITPKAAKEILKLKTAKPEPTEADNRRTQLEDQLIALRDSGADLSGMFNDATIAARINDGEWDVNMAYAYWQGVRASKPAAPNPPVATAKSGASGVRMKNFADMTSEEFAAYNARIEREIAGGKRVRL